MAKSASRSLLLDGYVRVSRVGNRQGERFISPRVQREEIRRWVMGRDGAQLLEIFDEPDESGGRADRPILEVAISRVERGVSQGLVVASLDRFGRSTLDGLLAIKRIRNAGGEFFTVEEGLDFNTAAGRWILRDGLSKAEYDLERVARIWAEATARAIARGVWMAPMVPPGYRKVASGRLRLDRRVAPIMAEVFSRRAAGELTHTLCRYLERHEVKTGAGNPGWTTGTLADVLANRVYLGEVRYGQHVHVDAHPAISDRATWTLAQRPRVRPTVLSRDAKALLTGMVRCGTCSMRMVWFPLREKPSLRNYYGCKRRFAGGPCPRPATLNGATLEACVVDVMFELLLRRRRAPLEAVRRAHRELCAAESALTAYRDNDRLLRTLGPERFASGLSVRVDRVRDVTDRLKAAQARCATYKLPLARVLEERWPDMDVQEQRAVLSTVIDCVFVKPGHRHAEDRVLVCPAGTAPADLPKPGRRRNKLRSYEPRRRWINASAVAVRPPRWQRQRIERELREFLGDRTDWPTTEAFRLAGRARLHRQVLLQEGEQWWADHFSVSVGRASAPWTDEVIRAALARYLADKQTWPMKAQFRADGLTRLSAAITRHGGTERWAQEMGIPRAGHYNGAKLHWTEERIRERLSVVCASRTTFPSERECGELGLTGMRKAIQKGRGVRWWASAMQVTPHPRTGYKRDSRFDV
jgi:site-specific DNA recombinase